MLTHNWLIPHLSLPAPSGFADELVAWYRSCCAAHITW